ncbi:hypothetical protein BsWGS_29179 [Bradybaena similaris]
MVSVQHEFHAWDYVVFAAMLVISLAIGIYFAVQGGKQKTQGEYLMANRSMSIVPVAISILVSFMSAILILGTPAEMYMQGTEYFLATFGICLGIGLAVLFFVPLLFPLKVTSAFEYLERRFQSRSARLMGTFLMVLTQVLYMGIAAYAPSTALEAVTGFPVWATVAITGAVATVYTSIGGMKAVIWTDVFQSAVMIAGMLSIVIQGSLEVGGMSRVWQINYQWDRIKFFNFDVDPTTRHSVWSLIVGMGMMWVGTYGINQASVQRYNSLPTLNKARVSVLLNMIGVFILLTVTCLCGIVLFAYYADKGCDPLGQKLVDNPNQLIPYFVMEILGYPGVPGLFISSLFSGALSSVSSSLNALAAITWEDVLKPHLDKRLSESRKTLMTKVLVVVYGALAIGMSFAVGNMEGTVLQASNSLIGSVVGPLTAMFSLGGFFPWANSYGAITGAICGVAMSMWMSVGAYVVGIPTLKLPFPEGTCSYMNASMITAAAVLTSATPNTTAMPTITPDRSGLDVFYSISYLWFNSVGFATTIIVGLLVSFITGANAKSEVPTKYQIPFFSRLCCCLPESLLYTLNCCRHFDKPEDIRADEADVENIVKAETGDGKLNDGYLEDSPPPYVSQTAGMAAATYVTTVGHENGSHVIVRL